MAAVTLVNYGLGNIQAFAHIYRRLNIPVEIAGSPEQLRQAQRLILPGVGAFDWAMRRLNASGLRDVLDEMVLGRKTPVLGVCVGMQMMANRSEEGQESGLGWIDADVRRFGPSNSAPLPHMGWNDVTPLKHDSIFRNTSEARYYFLHSYHVEARQAEDILAVSSYSVEFTSAIGNGSVFGTQFHPEKSHGWGIDLLKNFSSV